MSDAPNYGSTEMATDPTRPVESEPDYSEPIHMGTFRAVTSPSDYHQKLAEAIDLKLEQESGYGKSVSIIAAVLADEQVVAPATLQWWKDTCDYWDKQAEERDNRIAVQVASSKDLEQQLVALREIEADAKIRLDDRQQRLDAQEQQLAALRTAAECSYCGNPIQETDSVVVKTYCGQACVTCTDEHAYVELEQQLAALRTKAAEAENMLALAVKGRLMTSVSLHPVEIALAALRTGDSDA